jgi:hypothetical protein
MRRTASEAGLWLAVAGTAIVSFYFFEDAYRALEQSWPRLQASFAADLRAGTAQLPPLPREYPGSSLTVHLMFDFKR